MVGGVFFCDLLVAGFFMRGRMVGMKRFIELPPRMALFYALGFVAFTAVLGLLVYLFNDPLNRLLK
jgi:hypothetical protein